MKLNHLIFTLAGVLLLAGPVKAQETVAAMDNAEAVTMTVTTEEATQAELVAGEDVVEAEPAIGESLANFFRSMGFLNISWRQLIMLFISFFLLYLAIRKKYEPLLLLPIAFGMLLTNLPGVLDPILGDITPVMFHQDLWGAFLDANNPNYHSYGVIMREGGLLDILYIGVKAGIYPCLIFIGVGAMTDFGPLIANPKSLILGGAAQIGIFVTFLCANALGLTGIDAITFTEAEAGSIGIIGGADGPTSIFLTSKLAPHLLGPIAIAAYSYMALVPVIQPPIMRALTTKEEREIRMKQLRPVSKTEKIVFPVLVATIVALILPDAAPLIGCLMLGNLMNVCGVVDRLSKTAQEDLMNIVVIFLGLSVGATATGEAFLSAKTIMILCMGIIAFGMGSAGGVLLAKFINLFSKDKINPLIGSAGVSAVPMAARVSQTVGQEEDPGNFLLMHAMGPNVAGVIGSAVAAGVLLTMLG